MKRIAAVSTKLKDFHSEESRYDRVSAEMISTTYTEYGY
jgi:hypothetical protein